MFEAILALGIRSGSIVRVTLPDGATETLHTVEAGASPDGVIAEGGRIYWTTMGRPTRVPGTAGEAGLDYSARTGGVHSIRSDGTDPHDLVAPGAMTTGKQLASDGSGRLYWGDREGCRVSTVRTDGTGLRDLVVNPPAPDRLAECVGVAVDPARGHLYWTQKGPAKGGRGRILRAGLELPPGASPSDRGDIETLWDGLPEPIDLEIVGDALYWTDRGAAPDGNSLNRAPLPAAGVPGSPPEILAGGFDEAIGLAVDAPSEVAYVSDLGGRIWRVPLDGRAPEVLVDLGTPVSGIVGLRADADQH
ncbi:hypothetical protein [Tsukamurella paurometabola]|uniref:CAS/CSE protein involved in chromosome segregation n=1 Tax=Tsukamurella paurometabola TaxID=2061 RepID=A0A3P8L515_TSUPA|nr:hypothetical protein [Tsukamurella paurometabola]UEA83538.1 hypothetical protein LK411_01430 [Tsukamurella paurometabola]VDR40665.1 CAS/CSE protein involved in chromosome segregation [Tsukamurella paurometabola]